MNEESLFHEALTKPAGERAAFLDAACGGDADLRRRLDVLLQAHDQPGSFLDRPAVAGATSEAAPGQWIDPATLPRVTEGPGTRIGPYKLLQQVGEGGMGVVYMAEQEQPVRRKVALKIIKPGMDSRQVIARFEAERQALALMDHQNIARVLDAGTTETGRPYFVMELVKGVPITKFCDEQHLPPRERLELFVPVCQAIQHAHQKGIIHRDVKPSNVLVTLYDGKPVPKVIDFGVAKAIEQRLTERTLFTQIGQVVGTVEYMSPEQAELNALDIDTRSDIYSLGVLLYELLTGSTPLEKQKLRSAAFSEMLRMIREEEPPKPSTRLSASGDRLPSISAQRKTEPAKLTKLVRGELDWIVMKALEKDRGRRYETANGFARDVQRYLADEAVEACPPSASYRLRKFARRHKARLAVAGLVLFLLVLIGGGAGYLMRDGAARRAERERVVTEGLTRVQKLQDQARWAEALAAAQEVEEGLGAGLAPARLRERLVDLKMVARLEEARLMTSSAISAKACAMDIEGAEAEYARAFRDYGLDVDALEPGEAANRIRARPIGLQLAAALDDWSRMRRWLRGEADPGWRHLLAVAKAADPDPWRNRLRDSWERKDREALSMLATGGQVAELPAPALDLLGWYLWDSGATKEAVALLREAQRRHPADFAINFDLGYCLLLQVWPRRCDEAIRFLTAALALRPRAPAVYLLLGVGLKFSEMLDDAIAAHRQAIRLKPDYAPAYENLGIQLEQQGKLDEAIAAYRKALELNPQRFGVQLGLPAALKRQGKRDEAIAAYKKVEAACREAIGHNPNDPQVHLNLGTALHFQSRYEEAEKEYREAIRLKPDDAVAHNDFANLLADQGRYEEAEKEYREAIRLKPDHPLPHYNLAILFNEQGRSKEAEAAAREVMRLKPDYPNVHSQLGVALAGQGRSKETEAEYREAIRLKPDHNLPHIGLGNALQNQGRHKEAEAAYREAIRLMPHDAVSHYNLGNLLSDRGRSKEAEAEYREAIRLQPDYEPAHLNLGVVLYAQSRSKEAEAAYREAIRLKPDDLLPHNNLAWLLATCPDLELRDPQQAVAHAQKAVELAPDQGRYWNPLGVARYRNGNWKSAIEALMKSAQLRNGGDSFDFFFLAMAHWQLNEKEKARAWYDQAVAWMDKNNPQNEELKRFRAEAATLLGLPKSAESQEKKE
jgi:tetratricopeptide (TPR) repeat protein/serine/threonine protein kinase